MSLYKQKMNAARNVDFSARRWLNISEAATYCGVGCTSFRKLAAKIGAARKIGGRVVYDKQIIDAALSKAI